MRVHLIVGILLSLLLATAAFGDSITAISPSSLYVGTVETFITINGTGLVGRVSTVVRFSGDFGTIDIEPSSASSTSLFVFVPDVVASVVDDVEVTVIATDETAVRTIGPATLSIIARPTSGPPYLFLPEIVFGEAEGPDGAHIDYNAFAISQETGNDVPVECSHPSGGLFSLGFTTVTCQATDSGGTSVGSFAAMVLDLTPPVITLSDTEIVSTDPVVTFTATAVDLVDGNVPVVCSPPSGSTFGNGVTIVTCTATDARSNSRSAQIKVTVVGAGVPLLVLPDTIVAEATSPAGAVVTYEATALGGETVTCNPASGSTFALNAPQPTVVTCSATNSFGTATGTFDVHVQDTSAPVFTAPDVTLEATSAAGAVGTFNIVAQDLVDGAIPASCVVLGLDPDLPPTNANGYLYPFGSTQVECTATDTRSNSGSAQFTVTVVDTTGPTVTVTADVTELWPPNHRMVAVTLTVVAVDAVDPSPVSQIVSVSSNQPIDGTGDGDVAPDWEITGPFTVNLRAERSGSRTRVYTITVESTDSNGNTTTATVEVTVPGTKGKK